MNRHDPTLAVAHSSSIKARQEPDMFDAREAAERKAHDLEVMIDDLLKLDMRLLDRCHESLGHARTGVELICSVLKQSRLVAAE